MGWGLIFDMTYASVWRMKKIYNLFRWVVGVSLIALAVPLVAVAEEGPSVELPILYIQAINPGYKIDGLNDVGEMIEIRKNSDDLISLAGVTVRYTNSSGKDIDLVKFPENSYMAGESLILRYDKSPESELSNVTYSATLALKAGPVSLLVGDEVVDEVCWTNKDGCEKYFTSGTPTTLVRNSDTLEFEHVTAYEPRYDEASLTVVGGDDADDASATDGENLNEKPDDDEKISDGTGVAVGENDDKNPTDGKNESESVDPGAGEGPIVKRCAGLMFSEILSYYEDMQMEQFVEFYNGGSEAIMMGGCKIRYKGKVYDLDGEVAPGGYTVRWATDFKLTKNPTSSNTLEILDVDGEIVDILEYSSGQKMGTTWALVDDGAGEKDWRLTYAPTPGEENIYQKYRACEEGYYLNETTGRCRRVVVEEEKVCKEGYYLNEATGRCRKIIVEEEKICKDGYYLNEDTGRCRKMTVEEEKVCEEGYYLSEETGRCRKIVENTGAKYELTKETYEEESSFVALYAILGVVGVGVGYIVWEFRQETKKFFKKLFHRK